LREPLERAVNSTPESAGGCQALADHVAAVGDQAVHAVRNARIGAPVFRGGHAALLAARGRYAQMWQLQQQGRDEGASPAREVAAR
jgi:ATP-binding cassette, subfamily B, heavy metal transporter